MHAQTNEANDYERGRRDGRREVLAFLKSYAVTLAASENRASLLGALTRKLGADAAGGLAKLIEDHFAGRI
jgi:hypothetical protein